MLVKTQTLAKMFEANTDQTRMSYTGRCQGCGQRITIEIHHLSSGYGLLGGMLLEEGSDELSITCDSCLKGKTPAIH